MTTGKKRGRPGPALTIGIPMILASFAGSWVYAKFKDTPGTPAPVASVAVAPAPATGTTSRLAVPTTIVVAGDPWSGYSTFRGEPRLAALLAKDNVTIRYLDEEKYYDQNYRMDALARGEIDLAVTTLDAFLQHGANHRKDGQYPGTILFGIDESSGGDAIFLEKGRLGFDDIRPDDKVCFAAATPSEHLWDFASLSFSKLSDDLVKDNGVVAKDCWEKLVAGKVQIAVLWQPYTALARKAGYRKVFATGGQADDVILDIGVANRAAVTAKRAAFQRLVAAYFKTIDAYQKDTAAHGAFVTKDCGPDCRGDASLGRAVLDGIDFLTFEENLCIWFGHCATPSKLAPRIGKTGRLLVAKGKLAADAVPDPAGIIDDSFLLGLKQERVNAAKLAQEIAGPGTKIEEPIFAATDPAYSYTVPGAETAANVGTLELPQVFFDERSYALGDAAKRTVADIADRLRSFPALCVRVYGYTNSHGDAGANRRLSLLRALAIAGELTRIDPTAFPKARFDIQGFGSLRPILVGGAEDLDASRRTEFTLFECTARPKDSAWAPRQQ
jgi:outer membrane protein OmpA-like peptidoglycan-associated protein